MREFVDLAFQRVGLHAEQYVKLDPRLLRPADVDHLVGDYAKARTELGWRPAVSFNDLVHLMVDADVRSLERSISRGDLVPSHAAAVPHLNRP
ncbi:MAG: hypothetical protein NVS4B2_22760 [Chloroflexota bacterium]